MFNQYKNWYLYKEKSNTYFTSRSSVSALKLIKQHLIVIAKSELYHFYWTLSSWMTLINESIIKWNLPFWMHRAPFEAFASLLMAVDFLLNEWTSTYFVNIYVSRLFVFVYLFEMINISFFSFQFKRCWIWRRRRIVCVCVKNKVNNLICFKQKNLKLNSILIICI